MESSREYKKVLKEEEVKRKRKDVRSNARKKVTTIAPINTRYYRKNVRYIHDYDYIPFEYTKHNIAGEEDSLYMGFELEVDGGGTSKKNAKRVLDMIGEDSCFCVTDGSLDSGFEIVSNPSTLGYHKSLAYEEMLKFLKTKGYNDSLKAGLHVHINRDFFGDEETKIDFNIIKLIYLIEKHWSYTKLIARRENKKYARRITGVDSLIKLYTASKNIGKFACVNLEHIDTVELRLFGGTMSYMTLMATLEYVRNLAYICKATAIDNIDSVSFQDIVNYQPTEYLLQYCKNRKIQF